MELILAIAVAGPLGFLFPTGKVGIRLYLLAWAIVLPIQTVVVHNENTDDINWQYAVVNALILAGGVALNRLGVTLRTQRRQVRGARSS
jgi:hypothetical protein